MHLLPQDFIWAAHCFTVDGDKVKFKQVSMLLVFCRHGNHGSHANAQARQDISQIKSKLASQRQARAQQLRQLLEASAYSSASGSTALSASVASSEHHTQCKSACWHFGLVYCVGAPPTILIQAYHP